MVKVRREEDEEDFEDPLLKKQTQKDKKPGVAGASSLQKGAQSGVSGNRNMNFILGRNKSPNGGVSDKQAA